MKSAQDEENFFEDVSETTPKTRLKKNDRIQNMKQVTRQGLHEFLLPCPIVDIIQWHKTRKWPLTLNRGHFKRQEKDTKHPQMT